jgi:glycerol-3-phosphate dehydrogenase
VEGYPYIEAEVRYACQEYACTIEDILSRRTRLAFLNKDASMEALPRVADIMAEELGWSKRTKASQMKAAQKYLESYGGRIPQEDSGKVSLPLNQDVISLFEQLDTDGNGFLDIHEIKDMSERLGRPLSDKHLKKVFDEMDRNRNGKVEVEEFIHWLENSKDSTGFAKALNESNRLGGKAWLKRRSTTFLG